MKCFYEVQCQACGTITEKWVDYEKIPELECPKCREKKMRKRITPFRLGPACGFDGYRRGG